MYNLLSNLLIKHNIDIFAPVSLSNCEIKRAYLLEREGISDGTAFIIAVPYLSKDALYAKRNVSLYAAPRDYHLFCEELFGDIVPVLREKFPSNKFAAFTDHSPIDEVDAALKAGLGILGDNGMLICEKYSSFVFLGEIITDMPLESDKGEIGCCEGCELGPRSCPFALEPSERCLSAITQKKRELSEADAAAIISGGSVWGCDKCQKACPHTKKALEAKTIFTSVPFFLEKRLPSLTYRSVREMSDEEFSLRAYSWRGRETILRNLKLLEKDE